MTSHITMTGNLTRDPELRFTPGGRANCSFGLAVSRRFQRDGEWQEVTSFFSVVAWGTTAENAAASLSKGHRAVVVGRLEQREYEAKDGNKRSVVEVVADEIGPSLRWARATVERVERAGGSDTSIVGRPRSGDPIFGSEEPF